MNRTVKDATVKVFHYPDLESLKAHVLAFVTAYNFGKHLKRLRWRTPFQAICEAWANDPTPFKINPHHLIPGPYNPRISRALWWNLLGEEAIAWEWTMNLGRRDAAERVART
jgi:hypothetical protein